MPKGSFWTWAEGSQSPLKIPLDEKINSLFFFLQWGQDDWCPLSSDEGFCKSYLGSRMHFYTSVWISCLKRSFFCGLFSLAGWWWWGCCCWYCPQCSYCSNFPLTCMFFFFQISFFCISLGTPHKYEVYAQLNALEKNFFYFSFKAFLSFFL